jgi:S1-C subfamily serine protease
MKKYAFTFMIALLSGIITLGGYKYFFETQNRQNVTSNQNEHSPIVKTGFVNAPSYPAENTDFTTAAEATVDAVVHVKNRSVYVPQDPFEAFFYGRGFEQIGTGSGVIISADGYIITNNHVIANAAEIEVTLNNRKTYKAKLIGADETNDIALIKIEAADLPYIVFGDSDKERWANGYWR